MNRNSIQKFAKFAVLFGFVLIALGAWTRLADAGLGCPDWPGCYGHLLWPSTSEAVADANAAYPNMLFEKAKAIPEVVHRIAAGVMGLLVLILFFMALLVRRRDPSTPIALPGFTLVFICLQAWFGYYTVSLKLWPQIVTLHLLGGMTTLGLVMWQALPQRFKVKVSPGVRRLTLLALLVVVVQIALGGWVSSNYAALACADFPTCRGDWWPPLDFVAGFDMTAADIGPNYLGGFMDSIARVTVHYSHRLWALVVTAVLLLLIGKLWTRPRARKYGSMLLLILCLQLSLGVFNIIFYLPLEVAIAHNLGAALLLLSLLYTLGRTRGVAWA